MLRYLVSFDAKRVAHHFTDVLIIGGGIAGLRAALELPPDMAALIVTKDKVRESNSAYAQGGIASVLSPEDRFEDHIEDTIIAGAGLCDRAVVEHVVREAPDQIADLIKYGTNFDLENGLLALTQEGGHSHRRIVHALGDATGHEVMRAMIASARRVPNAQIWDDTFILDLLTHEGGCVGAVLARGGQKVLVWAKETILASGGAGMVYRETTNPPVATGDGMAAAWRAGARLRDMEFMQFHPTVLYVAGGARSLITEAVRGEGAYLRDKDGKRFMLDEDSRAEKATRDVVSQAIFRCMERTQHPNVYLDMSHLDPQHVRKRFPHIDGACRAFGLDITKDRIPVRPGAHYMVGGVTVDPQGRTTVPGLWAAGEVTSSGLHGANRLASNSLLEGLVFGASCGQGAAREVTGVADRFAALPLSSDWPRDAHDDDELNLVDLRNSLGAEMWRDVGIRRHREGLESAERQVEFWNRYVAAREFADPHGWELQNMLLVARLMIAAALSRRESRGTHFRQDYPQSDPAQAAHIEISANP